MKSSRDSESIIEKRPSDKRKPYQPPAIIYEGTITIRAGTIEPPVQSGPGPGGVGFPFDGS